MWPWTVSDNLIFILHINKLFSFVINIISFDDMGMENMPVSKFCNQGYFLL